MHRLVSHVTENGKFENRDLRLTPDFLEVHRHDGERPAAFARSEIAGAELVETGGGAWLEIALADGFSRRIAVSALEGIPELHEFRDRIRQWAGLRDRPGKESFVPYAEGLSPVEGSRGEAGGEAGGAESWSGRYKVLKAFMRYSIPHRRAIGFSLLALLITAGLQAVPPYVMKMIIDGGVLSSSESKFIGLIGLLIAVYTAEAGFAVLRTSIGIRTGNRIMSRIRKDMFDRLMELPVRYYDQRKTAPFIGRIQYDTSYVEGFLSEGIPNLLSQAVMTAAVILLLFTLDWRLAAVLAGVVPLCAVLMWWLWPKMRAMTLRTWNAEYGLQQYIAEALQGIRIIKAFHQEDTERLRFGERNAAAVRRATDQMRWSQWLNPGLNLAISGGIALVWLAGGLQVIRGATSLGTVMAFTAYLSMFLGQLRWSIQSAGWANKALASADRILELLETRDETGEMKETVALSRATGEISVRSVTFSYDRGREILKDVSFHIRPGEKVGVTGRSGAGKTTLIHLLCRFYDPDAGSITLDGIDLRRIPAADLRGQIGIVFQETFLFDGTIAQNIAYGCPDASPGDIMEAARRANAHDFISRLPYGYDTQIGERGVRLSGGEKQRISMARTLLLDPPILILDEATSSMDAETEREIQLALEELCRGRTTIAIAHRLSTLRSADRILVMDEGRLVETGTHDELEKQRGIYHQLLQANRLNPAREGVAG